MILEIRGCTGSGKSTIMRNLMIRLKMKPRNVKWKNGNPSGAWAYSNEDVVVLGNYDMNTGGLENRYSLDDIISLVDWGAQNYKVVLMEGGMISKTTGAVYRHLIARYRYRYHAVWLSVPLEECLQQLSVRRGGKPIRIAPIQEDMDKCVAAIARIRYDGIAVTPVTQHNGPDTILKIVELHLCAQ